MVSNTENVFYIVTDTSCFRLVSYQRKPTAEIGWVKIDKNKSLVWEKSLYFKDEKIILFKDKKGEPDKSELNKIELRK